MNQKLSDWASVAEIVSGIAVVLTLLFLIFEIRDNTGVMRATAFERNIEEFIDSRRMMAQGPGLIDILLRSPSSYSSMPPDEQMRARVWWQANFLSYEKAYYAQRYSLLGESESERFTRLACASLPSYGPELRADILEPLTREYIDYLSTAPECAAVRSWFATRATNGD